MDCRLLRLLATVCCVAGLAGGSATASAQNLLSDLGPATAYAINNSGQVVLSNGLYSSGTVTAFPTGFMGAAINSSGEVAGVFSGPNILGTAAFDTNGTVTVINDSNQDPTVADSYALGINDGGVVVGQGYSVNDADNLYPFVYSGGTVTMVPRFPGSVPSPGQAVSINNNGQVVGTMVNAAPIQSTTDAFIFNINTALLTDLGPGSASAINAIGQVVGTNAAGPFLYANGTMTPIPIPGVAISATGQVVGGKYFYSGGIIDLNDLVNATDPLKPFVTLNSAAGINDNLLIAVNGVDSRSQLVHAYLVQAPWITISPGPLTFPSQAVGTASAAQAVTITNAGATALPLDSISASGDFSQTNDCGSSLGPSGACTAMVTFSPVIGGDRTASLTITTSGVPVVVPLAGTSPIQISISSSATSVTVGTPVTLKWTASIGATCKATGGSSADGWIGTVAVSGTQSVTESSGGGYVYGLSCTSGSQSGTGQVSVLVNWPVVSASLTALPASFTAGNSITLTWKSANATSCTASGGGAGDTWPGAKATSGSAALTEPYAPAGASLTLTFTLVCTSSLSGLSATASVKSVENAAASSRSGGGGALDLMSVLFLAGMAAVRRFRRDP
jgi:hypothetical protein